MVLDDKVEYISVRGMSEEQESYREEWKQRLQAVGRAQSRYLYLLLIAGIFFWALHVQVVAKNTTEIADQQLPLIGVTVNRVVVWATAPMVLGLILLATIGTFSGVTRCKNKLRIADKDGQGFEQLDTNPNVIDFIAWHTGRLGSLLYPIFLWTIYFESCWIWICLWKTELSLPGRKYLMTLGIITLVWGLPLLVRLTFLKIKSMFSFD